MELFDKLDSINLSVLDRLNNEDKSQVVFIDKCYKGKLTYFESLQTDLTAAQTKHKEAEYFGRNSSENPFRYESYDLDNYVRKLGESITELKSYFVSKIISYFEQKYNLKLTDKYENRETIKALEKEPNLEQILGFIFEKMGGMTFLDTAKQNLKKDFQAKLSRNGLELKGDTIHLSNFIYVKTAWSGDYEVSNDYGIKSLRTLLCCISLFEFEKTENETGLTLPNWSMTFQPQEPFTLRKCTKAATFKIFKNGKLSLKFFTKSDAAQFWDYFELNTTVQTQ